MFCVLQETMACMDEDTGQSSDEDQECSRCDISRICVEELSQTARHVTRQVCNSPTAHAILIDWTLVRKSYSLTRHMVGSDLKRHFDFDLQTACTAPSIIL